MQRDPATPTADGLFAVCALIMESAKEAQDVAKYLPDTDDLPTTHEHFVYTVNETRNGQVLTVKYVGVRAKLPPTVKPLPEELRRAANLGHPATPGEPDNLNGLSDADLEVKAAEVGVVNYPKGKSRAVRVQAIREAQAKAVTA